MNHGLGFSIKAFHSPQRSLRCSYCTINLIKPGADTKVYAMNFQHRVTLSKLASPLCHKRSAPSHMHPLSCMRMWPVRWGHIPNVSRDNRVTWRIKPAEPSYVNNSFSSFDLWPKKKKSLFYYFFFKSCLFQFKFRAFITNWVPLRFVIV